MLVEFRLPDVGEGLHEAEVIRWLVAQGQTVAEDQPLLEVQTDKAAVELPSPSAGVIRSLHAADGEVVRVGSVLVTIESDAQGAESAVAPITALPQRTQMGPERGKGRWAPATPSTRRLARELGVDVNGVAGTGPSGRVTDDDVREVANQRSERTAGGATVTPATAVPAYSPADPAPVISKMDRRVPLRGIRAIISRHMVKAKATIPHAAVMEEADLSALVALRNEARADQPDLKLSYLPFVVKAVARTLEQFPEFNAQVSPEGDELILRGGIHIGFAAATTDGLLVPVIKDVNHKSITRIAEEIADLAERSRSRQIRPDEIAGSTFTISNIGSIGGLLSVPIINHPEVAILSVHKVQERPVGRDGQIVLRPMTYLTLAFDHRVIDGDAATRFIMQIVRYLEQPTRLLMEMI